MGYMNSEKLAERLAEARKEKKLTLNEVATYTGFASSYIFRIESGERPNFSYRLLDALIELYEIDINSLKVESDSLLESAEIHSETKIQLEKLKSYFSKKMSPALIASFAFIEATIEEDN